MLIERNSFLYSYPITRDFGFAPNPFHGYCTLATCKPNIRKSAEVGDWVIGVGGATLPSVRRKCIFLMKVTEKLDFEQYWNDKRFSLKKPIRNGSHLQMLGDNIYHKDMTGDWVQEDSHHSNPDGTMNVINRDIDTGRCDKVLVSECFIYFGAAAASIDLDSIRHFRIRDFKKTSLEVSEEARNMIESLVSQNISNWNQIVEDPCQFLYSHLRADQETGKIS
ncbi:hypothetical protein NFG57_15145 [Halomonas sp. H10-59]|uniref:Nucleotide modification associated domain-containing protein n=1 Tax=Halomonas sp. H10-59 TaxID=2950874 RepID=A0AAU7KRD8_9GAMM